MLRAWLTSLGVLLAIALMWVGAKTADLPNSIFNPVLWLAPIPVGFLMARLAPKRKLINGFLLAIPVAMMFAGANYVDEMSGYRSGFPGLEGALTVFILTLPTSLGFCGLGAVLGKFLFNKDGA